MYVHPNRGKYYVVSNAQGAQGQSEKEASSAGCAGMVVPGSAFEYQGKFHRLCNALVFRLCHSTSIPGRKDRKLEARGVFIVANAVP
jgi:hypothetical protein